MDNSHEPTPLANADNTEPINFPMNVVIAGAGIGGLAAGIALKQAGWSVRVLEQAEKIETVGAGIQISPNGCHVLQGLGVFERVKASAFMPEALEMRFGRSGRRVFNIPLQQQSRMRWGTDYLHVHRADLIHALADHLAQQDTAEIQTSQRLIDYQQHDDKVVVRTENDQFEADMLLGADGIHSVTRNLMLGPEKPRYTGNIAWRAVVKADVLGDLIPPPTACVWVGSQRHAVTYRLSGGRLVNFVGVVEQADWNHESWTEQGDKAALLRDFSGWHPTIGKIIQQTDAVYRWGLFDRTPLPYWSNGRVGLLGDACHPMLPFQAQGASCALEDAWVLAHTLSKYEVKPALQHYFNLRIERVSKMQRAARANMRHFHYRNPLAYAPMFLAGQLAPWYMHSRQDWIYGHNVTTMA